MAKNLKTKKEAAQFAANAAEESAARKVVLVGTYKGDMLTKWREWYCYPVRAADKISAADAAKINTLWLFKGAAEQKNYKAEFVGVKTRAELVRDYNYPAEGQAHGEKYLLFRKTALYRIKDAPPEDAERVFVRTADFARSPKVRRQLKAYLESPDRADPDLAKLLPSIVTKVPCENLRVCEAAVQLDFFPVFGSCGGKSVPFPPPEHPKFTFVDLFAGIGGFHQAMHQLGGKCVFACEWDKDAQNTYSENYGIVPAGDITKVDEKSIPKHDVLCAGFPCQAFSKAGKQLGFADETKGTLFFDVERILKYHKTKYVILENVRNLVAHDNGNTWKTIREHLKSLGYRLTPEPLIVSPHQFGIPQLRERVVVLCIYDPANADKPLKVSLPKPCDKTDCSLSTIFEVGNKDPAYKLTDHEVEVIDAWDEFHKGIHEKVIGFPIWADWFKTPPPPADEMPEWKRTFVAKNNALYQNNKRFIDGWLKRHHNLDDFTPTMRKMEWQCGTSVDSAWDAFLQMRPSGLRIKRPDCSPALVAIVQVPIIGPLRRRMTVREAARLQSFDDRFIPNRNAHQAYKQFGNAVNVQVIEHCAQCLFETTGAKWL